MPGPIAEAEDAQACKPGADIAARAGPTISWTWMLVPSQHLSKACSKCRGLVLEYREPVLGYHTPLLSTASFLGPEDGGDLSLTSTHSLTVHHHATWAGKLLGAVPSTSITPLQCTRFRSTSLTAARLWPYPPGASNSTGAVTIPAHYWHPGCSYHHGICFCHKGPLHGSPLCWDVSRFARGPAEAWLCCVSVLAVS